MKRRMSKGWRRRCAEARKREKREQRPPAHAVIDACWPFSYDDCFAWYETATCPVGEQLAAADLSLEHIDSWLWRYALEARRYLKDGNVDGMERLLDRIADAVLAYKRTLAEA